MQWNKRIIFLTIVCTIPLLFFSCGLFKKTNQPDQLPQDKDTQSKVEINALSSRISELEDRLAKAVQKNTEDKQTILDLQNQLSGLETRIKKLETKEKISVKTPQTPKKDPQSLYNKARTLLLEKQFSNAADDFSSFITAFPDHHLTDNAYYWLGECHYSQGSYEQAILLFKSLVKKYPKSPKVPDALLKTGYAYLATDDTNRAHHYLKQVIKKYPFSDASEKAEDRLSQFN